MAELAPFISNNSKTKTATGGRLSTGGANFTIDEILKKFDRYIRDKINKWHDRDEYDDAYQDIVMNLWKYMDAINAAPNPQAYILTIIKHACIPRTRVQKKLRTFNSWGYDDEDGDHTEEWLLEDDTFNPEQIIEHRVELSKRERAELYEFVSKREYIYESHKRMLNVDVWDKCFRHDKIYTDPNARRSRQLLKKLVSKIGTHKCGWRSDIAYWRRQNSFIVGMNQGARFARTYIYSYKHELLRRIKNENRK